MWVIKIHVTHLCAITRLIQSQILFEMCLWPKKNRYHLKLHRANWATHHSQQSIFVYSIRHETEFCCPKDHNTKYWRDEFAAHFVYYDISVSYSLWALPLLRALPLGGSTRHSNIKSMKFALRNLTASKHASPKTEVNQKEVFQTQGLQPPFIPPAWTWKKLYWILPSEGSYRKTLYICALDCCGLKSMPLCCAWCHTRI